MHKWQGDKCPFGQKSDRRTNIRLLKRLVHKWQSQIPTLRAKCVKMVRQNCTRCKLNAARVQFRFLVKIKVYIGTTYQYDVAKYFKAGMRTGFPAMLFF